MLANNLNRLNGAYFGSLAANRLNQTNMIFDFQTGQNAKRSINWLSTCIAPLHRQSNVADSGYRMTCEQSEIPAAQTERPVTGLKPQRDYVLPTFIGITSYFISATLQKREHGYGFFSVAFLHFYFSLCVKYTSNGWYTAPVVHRRRNPYVCLTECD